MELARKGKVRSTKYQPRRQSIEYLVTAKQPITPEAQRILSVLRTCLNAPGLTVPAAVAGSWLQKPGFELEVFMGPLRAHLGLCLNVIHFAEHGLARGPWLFDALDRSSASRLCKDTLMEEPIRL
jgi:hypothetical protein